ncbi:hypothetical protein VM98_37815, partial [Streptomyces rubellomurinus subsp. indigoferus]
IKFCGIRIVLVEIEPGLASHPGGGRGAFLVSQDTRCVRTLVGYVVPTADTWSVAWCLPPTSSRWSAPICAPTST